MLDEAVKAVVQRYLAEVSRRGIAVQAGFVFGSQVNGAAREHSDIDLVVISPMFDGDYEHETKMKLWEATAFTDARIEPVPCGEKEWETGQGSVFMFVDKARGEIVDRKI